MPQNAFTDGNFSLVIKGTKQDLSLLSLSFANVFLLRCKHLLHSINDKSSWLSMKRSTCPLFSPLLDVAESDAGVYSCNLHHHYCHLYETVKIQLDITKKGRCDSVVSFSARVSLAAEVQWSPGLELNSQWGLCADSQQVLHAILLALESSVDEGFLPMPALLQLRTQVLQETCSVSGGSSAYCVVFYQVP